MIYEEKADPRNRRIGYVSAICARLTIFASASEAIQGHAGNLSSAQDCFASLAMTGRGGGGSED